MFVRHSVRVVRPVVSAMVTSSPGLTSVGDAIWITLVVTDTLLNLLYWLVTAVLGRVGVVGGVIF